MDRHIPSHAGSMTGRSALFACLLVAFSSCSPPVSDTEVSLSRRESSALPATGTAPAWYDAEATRHDFGLIIAGSNVRKQHIYRVKNISSRAVRVRGVANLKPCCGELDPIAPMVVDPGQAVEVAVTIKVGMGGRDIVHRASIVTENEDDHVELVTKGKFHARVSLDGAGASGGVLAVGESRRVEYLIRSFGLGDDRPPALGSLSIRCNLPAAWIGPEESGSEPKSGIESVQRILAVNLPAVLEPGHRLEPLEVIDGNGTTVGRFNVSWEIAAALESSPPGLLFHAGAEPVDEIKAVVRSRDHRPFRILSAEAKIEPLNVVTDGADPLPSHLLTARLGGGRGESSRHGEIVIRTDRPDQPSLRIAVFIAGRQAGVSNSDGGVPR